VHVAHPSLRGRRILIVESEVVFGAKLQDALEHEGAETAIVRDPYSADGPARMSQYAVCAAAINVVHEGCGKALTVPVLLYGEAMLVPAHIDAIKEALERLLSR
jgi:hypothetical protein